MKKILFTATVRSHIAQFHIPFIKLLKNEGYEVDAAYHDNSDVKKNLNTGDLDRVFEVPFARSPKSPSNIKAYFKLKKIINSNNFTAIHTNTPMGGVVTRLAARGARKKGTKIIYTAHGFHFFRGAPQKNRLLYYPAEKFLSRLTDCIITINKEDYEFAKSHNFKCKVVHAHGVGVDLSKFKPLSAAEKHAARQNFGFSDDDFLICYAADICERKNQPMLIEAMRILSTKHGNIKLLLPGLDRDSDELKKMIASYGLTDKIFIMGYRRDMEKVVGMSDLSASSAVQEGLPINLAEAMALGNPIVATDVRGNNDLVKDGVNGFLIPLNNPDLMARKILELYDNSALRRKFGSAGREMAQKYSVPSVMAEMKEIYKSLGLL